MSGLGNIPYSIARPILEYCSAETLARLEDASPVKLFALLVREVLMILLQHLKAYTDGGDILYAILKLLSNHSCVDLWRERGSRDFPLEMEAFQNGTCPLTSTWRSLYDVCDLLDMS
jgi:hypothetical protein